MGVIINKKYEIKENIGEGTFGRVFLGKHLKSSERVAIKIQYKDMVPILKYEAKIYKHLRDISGIPQFRNFGTELGYQYLIMEYLDLSLDKYNFSEKEIIELIPKAINIIEKVHERGIIHRDIKPENFLFKKREGNLYLIDFGLSKLYVNKNNEHMEERKDRKLIGTAQFSSLNVHNGIEASRRDDLESLCYTFVFLFGKFLPWKNVVPNADAGLKCNNYEEININLPYESIMLLEKDRAKLIKNSIQTTLKAKKMLLFEDSAKKS